MIHEDEDLRLLGVEDGSFNTFNRESPDYTLLCGVLMEDNKILKIRHAKIEVDGLDATEKLLLIINGMEANAIILGGITFGGFNIVDPHIIFESTGIPVIVYSGDKPDNDAVQRALQKHFLDWEQRWEIIESLGIIHSTQIFGEDSNIYFEAVGCNSRWAEAVLKVSARICRIPEPVRVAGLIARGLTRASGNR